MKKLILFLLLFLLSLSFSSVLAQDNTTFPYLKPPNYLSTSQVIRLADGELIRSATSQEDMQTLVGSLFGADTYFEELNDAAYRKEVYQQVLREIVLMNVLEEDRKWLAYLTAASKTGKLSLNLLNPELMGDFFSLYRALIDNRYLLDNNVLNHTLNYLKQFGRMDTKISQSWWQAIDKLKLHEKTLDKVGKTLSLASFLSSIGSITLSALEAMNQEIAYQNLSLLSQTLTDMEGQGEYFNSDFKQALIELNQENNELVNSSFISDFTENFYYEWEKNKDNVSEKGLSLFMSTAGKKAITTTLQKAGLSHAALPALAWSLSIQYSYHVIQSGFKGIDLFHRYIITTDTLFWLRKMRDYAYANQDDSYLSFNLLDATSQLYAYQLLEALLNTTPQKLMFWKLGTRKLVLAEITSTQEELKSLFPEVAEAPKISSIKKEKIIFSSNRDGNYEIYIMDPDGSNQENLTDNTGEDRWPIISPDGTKIAFTTNRDGNSEIYIMNIDGTDQVNLTNNLSTDGQPSFSPDGSKIVFYSDRMGDPNIWIMNSNGSSPQQLTNLACTAHCPSFSPDGSKIVFTHRDRAPGNSFYNDLYIMDSDGQNVEKLVSLDGSDNRARFSSDGTEIVFSHCESNWENNVYLMNADGSNPTNLTPESVGTQEYPGNFSPDDTKIVYCSQRDGDYQIYIMNKAGNIDEKLTNNACHNQDPFWGYVVPL
ncbi:MAG: hypothetical protein KKD69_03685 [Euryarchaeota archaeon]|nr:hypothetical protein [Euryarchaeota archaeon]